MKTEFLDFVEDILDAYGAISLSTSPNRRISSTVI